MSRLKNTKGITLVELIVGIAMVGIFMVGVVIAYRMINKGVGSTKARTIANNLAQEKIEKLKDYNYYRLIATTVAALSNPNDPSNPYPPETVTVSSISFTRKTVVKKLKDSSGTLVDISPTDPDEGIKKIEVTIEWTLDNITKSITLVNLFQNPDRTVLDGTIAGKVTDTGSANVANVHVFVVDNPNRESYTDGSGNYSIKVAAGTYMVRADRHEYISQTSATLTVTTGATITNNFTNYTLKPKGNAMGYVFKNENLVISEVCNQVSAVDFNEYIELYNPTSSAVTINESNFKLKYVNSLNNTYDLNLTWVNNTIPVSGYFLIGSASTVNGVNCDAYWSVGAVLTDDQSGVIITDGANSTIDKVGWGRPGLGKSAPSNAVEGTGINLSGTGLNPGRCIERRGYPALSQPSLLGNAYDSQNNSNDFVDHTSLNSQNTLSATEAPAGGTAVANAYVFCNDDLSSPTSSSSSGQYTLNDIATGTWTLSAASSTKYGEATGVVINSGLTTSKDVILNTTSNNGYIEGRVISGVSGLASISMYCDGSMALTDSNGYYKIVTPAGIHYVTANYNNANANYTSSTSSTPITVVAGNAYTSVNFVLVSGGAIAGRVTSNRIDPVPNIVVIAKDFGNNERGNAITDINGDYFIKNLAVSGNNYSVFPALDDKEVSSPTSMSVGVVAGSTLTGYNFQVTTALGTISGTVKDAASKLITTGVLVIAVPTSSPITGDPPTVNSTLRGGSTVYYSTTSDSNGNYSLQVRGSATGNSYYVYAWWTDDNGISKKQPSAVSPTTITSNGSKTVNFIFN